jgi:DNA-binding transcriptional ArsR family regulator
VVGGVQGHDASFGRQIQRDNIFAKAIISFVITLRMPPLAAEHVSFELSPLAEAVHSWHVLATPGHHALQLPWVRACRELPTDLRVALKQWGWVVRDYVPALFEAGAGTLERGFAEERALVAALPAYRIARDLSEAVLVNAGNDPALLARVEADPAGMLAEILDLLDRYWAEAFAAEWRHLEPQLLDAIAAAGQALPGGVLPLLRELAPAIRLDPRRHLVHLDRPHDHEVDVAERGPLRLTPSFYTWPHVRVTCDDPWPLRLTYPVVPPSPHARRQEPAALLAGLRALAAPPRLEIVRLLGRQARSTQELAGLLGLSGAAISRHLKLLLDAGLVRTRREGYYVLYEVVGDRLLALGYEVRGLA